MYFLTNPGILTCPTNRIFPAKHQYNRYSKILGKVIKDHKEEFEKIGVAVGTIGSHSARKGAATLAATGCTVAPSMSSICSRAGWKLGGARDKYIKFESAGDQFLGRTLCGLNPLVKEFSFSPPFFNLATDQMAEIDREIMDIVVDGKIMEGKTFEVLRYCIASVVFHLDFLEETIVEKHRLRAHPMMTHTSEVSKYLLLFN